jgi:hypothetical protein
MVAMQWHTRHVVLAGALACAAGVIGGYLLARYAGTTQAVVPVPAGNAAWKPTAAYWHVWTDENGASHQTRCVLSAFEQQSMGGAAPQWNDRVSTSGATVLVAVQPVGWVGEWHENPKPQWIIPLSGRWFVETMDGTRVEMGPGEASFGNDQNCKPDSNGRKGHRSGTLGDHPATLMIVQLEQDPATGKPCRFK